MIEQLEFSPPAGTNAALGRGTSFWMPLLATGLAVVMSLFAAWFSRAERPPLTPEPNLAAEGRHDLPRRYFKPLSGPLEALISDPEYQPVPTQTHHLLGQPAPDFTLLDVENKQWTLAEHLTEGPVVLVFYYGYNCNHCVSQLFGLHKDIEKFRELGARVVAVSADPPELTRERFKKYGAFAFPVLSDRGNAVAEKYGTFIPSPKEGEDGDLEHGTFVISRQGKIVWANAGDSPFTENRTLLLEVHRRERPSHAP